MCMGKRKGQWNQLLWTVLFLAVLCLLPCGAAEAKLWKYGDQLTGTGKKIYQVLEQNHAKMQEFDTRNGIRVKLTEDEVWDDIDTAAVKAMDAFLWDYSDIFWVKKFTFETQMDGTVYFYPIDYYSGARSDIQATQQELKKAISCVNNAKGRYEKVKAAHDYIVKAMSFWSGKRQGYHYAISGGLLKKYGNTGVCEAYSKIFDAVCKACDIPSVIVASKTHMWNYVQMEDGKWYTVDVERDDHRKGGYDYFLVGSGDVVRGKKISSSNKAEGYLYHLDAYEEFKLPPLSKKGYKGTEATLTPTKKLSVSKKTVNLRKGASYTIAVKRTPKTANDKLTYRSSNKKVATVSAEGKVKAKKKGKATITVKAASGKKVTVKVVVK